MDKIKYKKLYELALDYLVYVNKMTPAQTQEWSALKNEKNGEEAKFHTYAKFIDAHFKNFEPFLNIVKGWKQKESQILNTLRTLNQSQKYEDWLSIELKKINDKYPEPFKISNRIKAYEELLKQAEQMPVETPVEQDINEAVNDIISAIVYLEGKGTITPSKTKEINGIVHEYKSKGLLYSDKFVDAILTFYNKEGYPDIDLIIKRLKREKNPELTMAKPEKNLQQRGLKVKFSRQDEEKINAYIKHLETLTGKKAIFIDDKPTENTPGVDPSDYSLQEYNLLKTYINRLSKFTDQQITLQ